MHKVALSRAFFFFGVFQAPPDFSDMITHVSLQYGCSAGVLSEDLLHSRHLDISQWETCARILFAPYVVDKTNKKMQAVADAIDVIKTHSSVVASKPLLAGF